MHRCGTLKTEEPPVPNRVNRRRCLSLESRVLSRNVHDHQLVLSRQLAIKLLEPPWSKQEYILSRNVHDHQLVLSRELAIKLLEPPWSKQEYIRCLGLGCVKAHGNQQELPVKAH